MTTRRNSPAQYRTDRAALEHEVVIESFRSGGPGGQHRNVTDSAIRLLHLPSGVRVIAADSRSQHRNRETAFVRLIKRLHQLNKVRKLRVPTRASRQAVERRLQGKRRRQRVKQNRGRTLNQHE
ncbi:MAG: peptide chain release factor-like protein [Nitrospiraceae bacterium]